MDGGAVGGQPPEHTCAAGTARYLAPETQQSGSYDESCDVYSFGLFLWELLHQAPPFEDDHGVVASSRALLGERPAICLSGPRESLGPLIQRCWQQEPHLRPTMETCMTELQSQLQRVPICLPPWLPERMQREREHSGGAVIAPNRMLGIVPGATNGSSDAMDSSSGAEDGSSARMPNSGCCSVAAVAGVSCGSTSTSPGSSSISPREVTFYIDPEHATLASERVVRLNELIVGSVNQAQMHQPLPLPSASTSCYQPPSANSSAALAAQEPAAAQAPIAEAATLPSFSAIPPSTCATLGRAKKKHPPPSLTVSVERGVSVHLQQLLTDGFQPDGLEQELVQARIEPSELILAAKLGRGSFGDVSDGRWHRPSRDASSGGASSGGEGASLVGGGSHLGRMERAALGHGAPQECEALPSPILRVAVKVLHPKLITEASLIKSHNIT